MRAQRKKCWHKNAETAGCISSLFRVIQAIVANNEKWTLQTNCYKILIPKKEEATFLHFKICNKVYLSHSLHF